MSGKIPPSFIQELLTRCDIVDVIDSRVPLKKAGNNYQACCPFHQEKTPSFTVSPSKQFYHCFGCGEHGNAISFIMNYDRLGFIDAVENLSAQLGLTVPKENTPYQQEKHFTDLYQIMQQAAQFYQQQLTRDTHAQTYLKQRGLTDEICQHFGIGYAPNAWDALIKASPQQSDVVQAQLKCGLIKPGKQDNYYDVFRHRIMFPIRDRKGRVVAFGGRVIDNSEPKYLNSPETAIFHKSSEVYGLYEAMQANRHLTYALLVEGYMDVVTLAQYGFSQGMACMGTASTKLHLERIYKQTDTLIFCFDGDNAGQKAAWRALQNLLPVLLDGLIAKFIFLPEQHDPDSFLRTYGADALQSQINDAQTFTDFFWQELLKEVELATLEGKAKLYKQAHPMILQMQDCALKTMMLQKLARYTGVQQTATTTAPTPARKIAMKEPPVTPMRRAMALLLQYPELAHAIDIPLAAIEQLPGGDLLTELLAFIRQMPGCNTASIIEAWREKPHFPILNKLATFELMLDEQNISQSFHDILAQLENTYYTDSEQFLFRLMQEGSITTAEKQILYNLPKLRQGLLSKQEKATLISQLMALDIKK